MGSKIIIQREDTSIGEDFRDDMRDLTRRGADREAQRQRKEEKAAAQAAAKIEVIDTPVVENDIPLQSKQAIIIKKIQPKNGR